MERKREMSKEQILSKVTEVFQELFEDENLVISYETTAADIDGWDSLTHITLIEEIEDAFDVRFKMNEVTSMKNVGEMIDIILERAV